MDLPAGGVEGKRRCAGGERGGGVLLLVVLALLQGHGRGRSMKTLRSFRRVDGFIRRSLGRRTCLLEIPAGVSGGVG